MNGVLVVNKPQGITSSDVCQAVKKALCVKKVGHLGTLDPLATGVLPLCINEGTKLAQFLMRCDKEYVATMRLGVETDTQDSTGAVLTRSAEVPGDEQSIRECIGQFAGPQLQTPPMYSALKRGGVPLYAIARAGGCVPREQRPITIYEIEALRVAAPDVRLRVVCSHGTYVRTICHDIGRRLGCGAHLTALERTRCGAFHIGQAVALQDITAFRWGDRASHSLVAVSDALGSLPSVAVDAAMEHKLRNGLQAALNDLAAMLPRDPGPDGFIKAVSAGGRVIAVIKAGESGAIGPARSPGIVRIFSPEA